MPAPRARATTPREPNRQRQPSADRQRRQPDIDREIPCIEEAERAEQQRRQDDAGRAKTGERAEHGPEAGYSKLEARHWRLLARSFQLPASCFQHQVQRQTDRKQHERQRQDVRVKIAQKEAEEREFVDHFDRIAEQVPIMDHARGAPPPPEPTCPVACRRRVHQLLYVDPLDPGQRRESPVIGDIDDCLQVTDETDEQCAEKSEADAAAHAGDT